MLQIYSISAKSDEYSLNLCHNLTIVESRHDSVYHANMLLLAAPRLENN